jgi:hypothetical protein
MGLYVSITLIAALTLATGDHTPEVDVLAIVWGTTVGLALAHWFAFVLAARIVGPAPDGTPVGRQLVVQLGAALAVAVIASVPVLLLPDDLERAGARFAAAGCIAVVAFVGSRSFGASKRRSLGAAVVALALGLLVAGIKQALGH